MNNESIVSELEREWDFDCGFFGMLRRGIFDVTALRRLICILDAMNLQDEVFVSRRVVSLLWYMPLFMGWQRERIEASGGDTEEFDKATDLVQPSVERLLGVP